MSTHLAKKILSLFGKRNKPTAAKDDCTAHACTLPDASEKPHQANAPTAVDERLESNLNELKNLKQIISNNNKELAQLKNELAEYKKNPSTMTDEIRRAIDKLNEHNKLTENENKKYEQKFMAKKNFLIRHKNKKIYEY